MRVSVIILAMLASLIVGRLTAPIGQPVSSVPMTHAEAAAIEYAVLSTVSGPNTNPNYDAQYSIAITSLGAFERNAPPDPKTVIVGQRP